MFKNNEQITAQTQKALDTALDLAAASIGSVEKLTHIQLESSRQIIEEASQAVKELATLTDPKAMFARVNQIATQAVERNIASARDVYAIVSAVQAKVSKVAEDSVQNLQQAALSSVEGLAKLNPSGANLAGDSIKTWIDNTNQALSAMNKVAAQVNEFTTNNLNAATAATASSAKKTSKK